MWFIAGFISLTTSDYSIDTALFPRIGRLIGGSCFPQLRHISLEQDVTASISCFLSPYVSTIRIILPFGTSGHLSQVSAFALRLRSLHLSGHISIQELSPVCSLAHLEHLSMDFLATVPGPSGEHDSTALPQLILPASLSTSDRTSAFEAPIHLKCKSMWSYRCFHLRVDLLYCMESSNISGDYLSRAGIYRLAIGFFDDCWSH